jgi:hypothetical protein
VVDGSGLENRRTRKGTGGSNPSLSAIVFIVLHLHRSDTCADDKEEHPSDSKRVVEARSEVENPIKE